MITSRFPLWRTNPAGFGVSGYWPALTGVLAVVFVPVLIGFMLNAIAFSMDKTPFSAGLGTVAVLLMSSSFVSWMAMIVAVPISAALATEGFAGWAVAALGGALVGFVVIAVVAQSFVPSLEVLAIVAIGAALALIYWGAVRVMHPTAIGIPFKNVADDTPKGGPTQ